VDSHPNGGAQVPDYAGAAGRGCGQPADRHVVNFHAVRFAQLTALLSAGARADPQAVLGTYSEDVVYQDPGSGGRITGKETSVGIFGGFWRSGICNSRSPRIAGLRMPMRRSACGT